MVWKYQIAFKCNKDLRSQDLCDKGSTFIQTKLLFSILSSEYLLIHTQGHRDLTKINLHIIFYSFNNFGGKNGVWVFKCRKDSRDKNFIEKMATEKWTWYSAVDFSLMHVANYMLHINSQISEKVNKTYL